MSTEPLDRRHRTTADWKSMPMTTAQAGALVRLLRDRYGARNVRWAVLARTGAVEKVIDNGNDATATLLMLERARLTDAGVPAEKAGQLAARFAAGLSR